MRQGGREAAAMAAGLMLLLALSAAAFAHGAFSGAVQWLVVVLVAGALAVALAARLLPAAGLHSLLLLSGASLAAWALLRAALAGTPASGLSWALFGAGTAAVIAVCGRLDDSARGMLLGGMLAAGVVVALTGWLGVALHRQPWALPDQGLWRAASTLTYENATAALLVPLALAALALLTAAPRPAYPGLAATVLLTGAGATLSRAGAAALAAGLLALCWALGPRAVLRALAGPATGAAVALLGLVPSLPLTAPARPLVAAAALAAGLAAAALLQRAPRPVLILAGTVAALAAAAVVSSRVPAVHDAVRVLGRARVTLASPARSGETGAAWHLIERHPLAGAGPGHATLRWPAPGGGVQLDPFAHDEYLQVLADLGIAGAILCAGLLISAGRLLWRARPDLPQRAAWAGAVAAVTAFLVHSGFDFTWQVPAIPLTVAVIAGLAAGQPPGRRTASPIPSLDERTSWNAAQHED